MTVPELSRWQFGITAPAAVPLAADFLAVTQVSHGRPATDVAAALAAVTLIGGTAAAVRGREGWAYRVFCKRLTGPVSAPPVTGPDVMEPVGGRP